MKRKLLVLAVILSLVFAVSCSKQSQKPKAGAQSAISGMGDIKTVRVIGTGVGVKSGCSNSTATIHTPAQNDTLDVLSKVSDWYAVKLPNNAIGFIPQSQAKPIVPSTQQPSPTQGTPGTGTTTTPSAPTGAPTNPGSQTNPNSSALTADEQQMLTLINQARSQNGLAPLQVDMQLTNMARVKSQDMITNNYFSHYSPTYGSPFDMMKSFGISYVKAGENIAGNQTVQAAHNALMNSPGHRANILDKDFTHIGIGIKNGGTYGKMFTQDFVSRPR